MSWDAEREQALLALAPGRPEHVREEAAELLWQLARQTPTRAAELSEALPTLMGADNPTLRRFGVALAAQLLPPGELAPWLVDRLRDDAAIVRVEATGQLADLALPHTRGAFAALLSDESLPVRFEAARGMAALRHPAGLDVLLEALDHADLRFRALGALGELGDARAAAAVKRLLGRWFLPPFERTQAAGVLALLGDPSGGSWLLARTKRRWGPERAHAVELLGEVKAAGAFERLVELLADEKDSARGAAARGLGRLGDPRALPALLALLERPPSSEALLLDAAEGLSHLGGRQARAALEALSAQVRSPDVRAELRELLDTMDTEEES